MLHWLVLFSFGFSGVLFGAFFFTLKPVDVDTTRPFREQFKQQYKTFIPDVARSSKSFAKLGFIYSLVECFIQRVSLLTETTWAAPFTFLFPSSRGLLCCMYDVVTKTRNFVILDARHLEGRLDVLAWMFRFPCGHA